MSDRKVFIFSMSAVETNKMISEQCLVFLCNSDMNMSKFYLVTYSSINPSIIFLTLGNLHFYNFGTLSIGTAFIV